MLYWTIKWIITSLVLIILIHYLYAFFKNTLTVPKVRDLVNKPTQRYNEILATIKEERKNKPDEREMQNELQNFLQDLKQPKKQGIVAANETEQGNGFSSY